MGAFEIKVSKLAAVMGWTYREAIGALAMLSERLNLKKNPTASLLDVHEGCRCASLDEARKLLRVLMDLGILKPDAVESGKVYSFNQRKKAIASSEGGIA